MTSRIIALMLGSAAIAACQPNTSGTDDSLTYDSALASVAQLREAANRDTLLAPWSGPYGGVPPWDKANASLVSASLELGIALQEAEIQVIATNPAAPSFDNTIATLEDAGRHLDRASTIFSVMTNNLATPEVQDLDAEWSPRLSAAYNAIVFNGPLFARIQDLYAQRQKLELEPKEIRLLELKHDRFSRVGAALSQAEQERVGAINEELASKFAEFNRRLLADEDAAIFITDPADLASLPDSLREAYAAAATERGHAGEWAVVNTRSSVDPFLSFAANRSLREQIWRAFKNRGDNGDANDTNAIIADISRLRVERARILGFPTHAHYRMADTMARDPARAQDLMLRVWPAAVARVHEEVADMQAIANRGGADLTIEPWDYLYYAELVRRERYDLDQNALRSYFVLDNMIAASMSMAKRLYGLNFEEITGKVPVFHPDVRVWEVRDRDGSYVGLFYGDYFARSGKGSGAWASGYRGHETFTGRTLTPIVSNNNNFVRAAGDQPLLISLDDARTLFHEFGHALHGLLSNVAYPGLRRTPRDYVEYPSQVHEHWVLSRETLDRFARHYETGKVMPQSLVDRVHSAATFNQGYTTVEYLSSGLVDMAMHNRDEPVTDVDAFERETLAKIGMPREMAMRHRLPQFGHLFSSDAYSAGYYSYLWSEVMDADTWEMFEASGDVFNPEIAAGMRNIILAPGNSTDRGEAYRLFRGRDPDVNALMRVRGFPTAMQ